MRDALHTVFPDTTVPDLLDAIPHPIVVSDRELRVVAVNSRLEALTGRGQDEASGLYVEFVLRASIGGRGRIFREVLESGQPRVIEGDILGRDRRRLAMQVQGLLSAGDPRMRGSGRFTRSLHGLALIHI